jgi:hypothetical protein
MTSAIASLEAAGLAHGSISAGNLWLHESGKIQLTGAGFRTTLLTADSLSDDILACGLLWWHLLTGRPPIAAGNGQSVPNVWRLAPDTHPSLAQAIHLCTRNDPAERPLSFATLAEMLGPPTPSSNNFLAAHLLTSGRRTIRPPLSWRIQKAVRRSAQPLLAAAVCAALILVAILPLRHSHRSPQAVAVSNVLGSDRESVLHTPSQARPERTSKPSAGETADHAVRMVNYQTAEATGSTANDSASNSTRPIIEIESNAPLAAGSLRIQQGAVVRGKEESRLTVLVPLSGLAVTADNVRFENIDFLWRGRATVIAASDEQAIIDQRATHTEFVGCTFHAIPSDSEGPIAIRLSGSRQMTTLAPALRLKLDRCVIDGAANAIDCPSRAPLSIEIHDSLFLGSGSLVHFSSSRPIDAPAAIEFEHVTLRGATSVMKISCDEPTDAPAQISVTAKDSVFAPADGGALVMLSGSRDPRKGSGVLKALEWSGQGSLVAPQTPISCLQAGGQREELPEDYLAVEGLVASAFEFSGPRGSGPAASQLHKWLAPLTSDEPPGISDGLPRIPEAK